MIPEEDFDASFWNWNQKLESNLEAGMDFVS